MSKNKDPKFKIRVFDVTGREEYNDIYDDLYEDKYASLVVEKNLICCKITATTDNIKQVWESMLYLYEGMCCSVEAIYKGKTERIIGGTVDDGCIEYIEDYLDNFYRKHYYVTFEYTSHVTLDIRANSEQQAVSMATDEIEAMNIGEFHNTAIHNLKCIGHKVEKLKK